MHQKLGQFLDKHKLQVEFSLFLYSFLMFGFLEGELVAK